MTKTQQDAFNKALLKTIKGDHVKFIANKDAGAYIAMVSVKTILDNFKPFIAKINKQNKVTKTKRKAKKNQ